MNRSWPATVLTGFVALLAAVAITGLPSQTTDGIEIGPPRTTTTTEASPTTAAPTAAAPTTTSRASSTTSDPGPAASTALASATSEPTSTSEPDDPATDATAGAAPATASPILGSPDQTDGATADIGGEPVARDVLTVAVANATIAPGLAGRTADELEALGYVDVGAIDTDAARTTVLYHAPDHAASARRLLADLGFDDVELQPLAAAPDTTPPVDVVLLLVRAPDSI